MHDDTGRLPGRRETDFEEGRPPPGDCTEDGRRRVKHRELLNLLNFVNFSEGTIFVSFSPREPGESIFLQAAPRLCQDEVLCCRWLSPGISPGRMNSHTCDSFLISDGHNEVSVKAEVLHLDAEGISFKIPESGYEKSHRRVRRHSCAGIEARLTQTGLGFDGRLLDFNALSFRVEVCAPPDGSLRWINPAVPLTALFYGDGKLLYSGECLILRMDGGPDRRSLVLSPNFNNISRRRPKEFRSERHVLSPAPAVSFVHPFTGTAVHLQAKNISGAGLCVEEFLENSSLLPGMIIPEISIEIANRLMLRCRAQVLYRNVIGNGDRFAVARCGITMLDMDIRDQAAFSALLHQSIDDRMHVCGPVDLEELWRFFFESGFIYPSKYLAIEAHKQEFRRTYEKLYRDSPSIGRHFIFQDRGRIFGHMSMIRCHSNSWLIHHHAASRDGYGMAGVEVLNQA
ncbi:MAG TPA: hypothetical protein VMC79_01730, partial [Rectinemataceae bacterium]|nr:hypothetical protein [Rectinemataceae bacterium]